MLADDASQPQIWSAAIYRLGIREHVLARKLGARAHFV